MPELFKKEKLANEKFEAESDETICKNNDLTIYINKNYFYSIKEKKKEYYKSNKDKLK